MIPHPTGEKRAAGTIMDTVRDIERLFAVAGKVLAAVGLRAGQRCVDFGCGYGNYTIPLARLVGPQGEVLALDRDTGSLDRLADRLRRAGLENVRILPVGDTPALPLEDASADGILLYDVLHDHYFSMKRRKALLEDVARVIRPGGRLSVFPNHMTDRQIDEEVVARAGRLGFEQMEPYRGPLVHDDGVMEGRILVLRKAMP